MTKSPVNNGPNILLYFYCPRYISVFCVFKTKTSVIFKHFFFARNFFDSFCDIRKYKTFVIDIKLITMDLKPFVRLIQFIV